MRETVWGLAGKQSKERFEMKVIKYSILVYVALAALIFLVIYLAAAPRVGAPAVPVAPPVVASATVDSVERVNEELRAVRQETEQLRRLMWGATGKNQREIESLRSALADGPQRDPARSITAWAPAREASGYSDAGWSEEGEASGSWAATRARLVTPELEAFEAILTEEQRTNWTERVEAQVQSTHDDALSRIPEELRGAVEAEMQAGMDEFRDVIKYSVLDQMLTEVKLRDVLEGR